MNSFPAAMILAAGRGERMRPLSREIAKPALPVLGRSLLGRILFGLATEGVRCFAVNAFHAASSIRAALDAELPPGCRAELFVEDTLMDTGGALARPAPLLAQQAEYFVLHNGDTLVDFPLRALLDAATASRRLGALLVSPRATAGYRPIGLRNGLFTGLATRPGDEAATYLGAAVFRRELLERVPADRPSSLFADLVLPQLAKGWELAALPYEGPWLEFTSPGAYLERVLAMLDRQGGLYLGDGAQVAPSATLRGGVAVEATAKILAGSQLEDTVLMRGAIVAEGCRVERAILAPGSRLEPGGRLREAVLIKDADGGMITSPIERSSLR